MADIHTQPTDFERLNDDTWRARISEAMPPELPWLDDLIVR